MLHISDATPDTYENVPSQSNNIVDRNNDPVNPDVIAKNGKAVLLKNK